MRGPVVTHALARPLAVLTALLGAAGVTADDARAGGFLLPEKAPGARPWQLQEERVEADVRGPHARVVVTQLFRNMTDAPLHANVIVPRPRDDSVSDITLFDAGRPMDVRTERDPEAFEKLLRAHRDPALVRYVGAPHVYARLSPIAPNATRRVTLKYNQRIGTGSGASEWCHEVAGAFAAPEEGVAFSLRLTLKGAGYVGPVYCPHFAIRVHRGYGDVLSASLDARIRWEDPAASLYWSASGSRVGPTLMTHWPADEAKGYFLFLAEPAHGNRGKTAKGNAGIHPKTIHFVVDTSGSMAGEKLEQVRAALRHVIAALNPRDRFNVVAYNTNVVSLWKQPREFSPASMDQAFAFIDRLQTSVGTHLEAALAAVLSAPHADPASPSVVLLLSDGRPTLGETDAHKILEKVRQAQTETRTRIFSLGVGVDVNSVLLDRLALESRAVPEYIKPREDVEQKVAALYEQIRYPVLTDIVYDFDAMNASDVLPTTPPDLYRGSRLVLAGRYDRAGAVELVLRGHDGVFHREYHYPLKAAARGEGVRSDFPARIWATRRIAQRVDAIRLHNDASQSLVDEIVLLSKRFGILTEYTLYLAGDTPGPLTASANRVATQSLLHAQVTQRVGNVAWAQSKNQTLRRQAAVVPRKKSTLYLPGANDRDVQALDLGERKGAWPRMVANRTFYYRATKGWIDATIDDPDQVDETVHRWSERFYEVVRDALPADLRRLAQFEDVLLRVGERTLHVVDGK